jgi:hypothetical protein
MYLQRYVLEKCRIDESHLSEDAATKDMTAELSNTLVSFQPKSLDTSFSNRPAQPKFTTTHLATGLQGTFEPVWTLFHRI